MIEAVLLALVLVFAFTAADGQETDPIIDHHEVIRIGWDEVEGHEAVKIDTDEDVRYSYTVYACDKPIPDQPNVNDPITCPDGKMHFWRNIVSNSIHIRYPAPTPAGIAYIRVGVTNPDGHTLSETKVQYVYPTATLKPPIKMEVHGARLVIETNP